MTSSALPLTASFALGIENYGGRITIRFDVSRQLIAVQYLSTLLNSATDMACLAWRISVLSDSVLWFDRGDMDARVWGANVWEARL